MKSTYFSDVLLFLGIMLFIGLFWVDMNDKLDSLREENKILHEQTLTHVLGIIRYIEERDSVDMEFPPFDTTMIELKENK